MTLTPALETEIEDMGGTALEATDEAITFPQRPKPPNQNHPAGQDRRQNSNHRTQ